MWSTQKLLHLFNTILHILHAHAVNNKMCGCLVLIGAITVTFDRFSSVFFVPLASSSKSFRVVCGLTFTFIHAASRRQKQKNVHKWARANPVSFDPAERHFVILYPAVDRLMAQINLKNIAILRTRGYYSVPQLIVQFKTHIWGLMECNMGGFFHASTTLLARFDHARNRFLSELDMNAEHTLLELLCKQKPNSILPLLRPG